MKNVRVLASTGTPGDALDVLVTDLHIRADGFVKIAVAPPTPVEARSSAAAVVIALAILVMLALAAPLGLWLFLRRRPGNAPSEPAPSRADTLIFACSRCGKKIKVKPERARKTLKCPHCGNAVKTPDDAEDVS